MTICQKQQSLRLGYGGIKIKLVFGKPDLIKYSVTLAHCQVASQFNGFMQWTDWLASQSSRYTAIWYSALFNSNKLIAQMQLQQLLTRLNSPYRHINVNIFDVFETV